ncbi:MAG: helix-turn-helix domain-containing protein [Armatimonadota bacterium]
MGPNIEQSAHPSDTNRIPALTKREVEVLMLIIDGRSSKEVAQQLFVSKRTVDFHLANVYHKLNVTNRVQAFRRAANLGLIPFELGGAKQLEDQLNPLPE